MGTTVGTSGRPDPLPYPFLGLELGLLLCVDPLASAGASAVLEDIEIGRGYEDVLETASSPRSDVPGYLLGLGFIIELLAPAGGLTRGTGWPQPHPCSRPRCRLQGQTGNEKQTCRLTSIDTTDYRRPGRPGWAGIGCQDDVVCLPRRAIGDRQPHLRYPSCHRR